MGSGCGSVGRAVATDTRDPRFKPRHRQSFIHRITNFISEKTKIKKIGRECPIFKTLFIRLRPSSLLSVFPADVTVLADDEIDLLLNLLLDFRLDRQDPDGPTKHHGLRLAADHEHLAEHRAQALL